MGIPLAEAPLAYALLLLIPMASLYGLLQDRSFVEAGLFDIGAIRKRNEWYRMITPAFLHADTGHLLVNGLTLFFFGPAVEYLFGTGAFAILFFGSQLGAQGFTYWRKKDDLSYQALGASGAVSGIVLAFCVVRPFEMLYVFFLIPMPAILFAGLYLAYSTYAMGRTGRIAHEAHIGGAVTGAAIALLMAA